MQHDGEDGPYDFLSAFVKHFPHAKVRTPDIDPSERGSFARDAVEAGRLGKSIVMNTFKGVMGTDLASEYANTLMASLFREYMPSSPGERMLVENLGVLHAQLMFTRTRWVRTNDLADLEALTRVQNRLMTEMGKVMATLIQHQAGSRPIIQQANIAATQQIITQNVLTSEQGSNHA